MEIYIKHIIFSTKSECHENSLLILNSVLKILNKICLRGKTYRKLSFLTDFRGMKNAIGEMRRIGFPTQPSLNQQLFQEPTLINSSS